MIEELQAGVQGDIRAPVVFGFDLVGILYETALGAAATADEHGHGAVRSGLVFYNGVNGVVARADGESLDGFLDIFRTGDSGNDDLYGSVVIGYEAVLDAEG